MRVRGSGRVRLWIFAGGLLLALALFAGGIALAASQTIVGQADNSYTASTYTTDQGEVVQFQVTGSSHNVTAHQNGPDGKALFRTPTISGGTTGVQGTQYLSAGTYTFFCSVHPSTMQATLVVSSNGTPQARPQVALGLTSRKLSKVLKKGFTVAIDSSAKVDGASITAKLGKTTIASANGLSFSVGRSFQVMRLNKAGRSKLRHAKKAAVTLTGDVPFGSPATAKAKLK